MEQEVREVRRDKGTVSSGAGLRGHLTVDLEAGAQAVELEVEAREARQRAQQACSQPGRQAPSACASKRGSGSKKTAARFFLRKREFTSRQARKRMKKK